MSNLLLLFFGFNALKMCRFANVFRNLRNFAGKDDKGDRAELTKPIKKWGLITPPLPGGVLF